MYEYVGDSSYCIEHSGMWQYAEEYSWSPTDIEKCMRCNL
jgi:hypothetical protein